MENLRWLVLPLKSRMTPCEKSAWTEREDYDSNVYINVRIEERRMVRKRRAGDYGFGRNGDCPRRSLLTELFCHTTIRLGFLV